MAKAAAGEVAEGDPQDRVVTIPNAISVVRLAGVPVFLWLVLGPRSQAGDGWAVALLISSGASDWLDGKIARALNQQSRLGQVLDPAADRLYIAATADRARHARDHPVVAGRAARGPRGADGRGARRAAPALVRGAAGQLRRQGGHAGLLYAFPLLFLGAHTASYSEIARIAGWAFAIWGTALYWVAAVLYVEQARRLYAGRTGGQPPAGDTAGGIRGETGRWAAVKAVVMAGGEGTRLRPMTANQPKPMLPVVNRPIMEHVLRLLRRHGFDRDRGHHVQFLASLVRNYFGDGEDLGMSLQYATEETPLGTAGSVKNAEDALRDEPFLVISGDALTDIDLSELVRFHKENGALVTVGLTRVPDPLEFGIIIIDDEGRIERFLEKPTWGQVFSDTVNTGIYVMEPEVLDEVPAGEVVDWSGEVLPAAAGPRRAAVRLGRRRLLGGRRHPRELPQGPGRRAGGPGAGRDRRLRGVARRLGRPRAPRSTRTRS